MAAKALNDGYDLKSTFKGTSGREVKIEYRGMLGPRRNFLMRSTLALSQRGYEGVEAATKATCEAMCAHLISLTVDDKAVPVTVENVSNLPPDEFETIENRIMDFDRPKEVAEGEEAEPTAAEESAKN